MKYFKIFILILINSIVFSIFLYSNNNQIQILNKLSSIKGIYVQDNGKVIHFTDKTNLIDSDLACLQDLSQIEVLSINSKNISSKGFIYIKYLINLRVLNLTDSNFSDNDMENFKNLKNLERLDLTGTKVTDNGFQYLQDHEKLKYLYIAKNNISDNVFRYLEKMHKLHRLTIYDTNVTKEKVIEFWKKMPDKELDIIYKSTIPKSD